MVNAVIVIVALIFAVISHEFGHMVMTKFCGVPVPEFGIGFGRKVGSFRFNGTNYRIGIIPLGGYVKPDDEAFYNLPAYKRNLVYLAGPLVNIGSAAFLLWSYWMTIGMNMGNNFSSMVIKAGEASLETLGTIFLAMGPVFQEMGVEALMGPVGAIGVAAQSGEGSGLLMLLIVVMLLFSLGIMNLLPIPALDGGQILMTTLRVPAAIYNKLTRSAMYALLGLGMVIMVWDIYRIVNGTLAGI